MVELEVRDATRLSHDAGVPVARALVLSSLFPSAERTQAGVFIRERVFRTGRHVPSVVLAPQAWAPFQGLVRVLRPHFRPMAAVFERQQEFEVHRPRFLCFPLLFKQLDGLMMAASLLKPAATLVRRHGLNVIDAHFAYPDGYAATLLGRWLGLPVMITLRGKEEQQMKSDVRRGVRAAVRRADTIVCVSRRLAEVAVDAGADPAKVAVIGNGVDLDRFHPVPRAEARRALGVPVDARVFVSVASLLRTKGHHRVIACLPELRRREPRLVHLIVGGPGHGRDESARLKAQARELAVDDITRFLGAWEPDQLKIAYSAADAFVLATDYEGWANVFLEAMACGLPVVTTRVGGNADVVCSPDLGLLADLDRPDELLEAMHQALVIDWDRSRIRAHAASNSWDVRIPLVVEQLDRLARRQTAAGARP